MRLKNTIKFCVKRISFNLYFLKASTTTTYIYSAPICTIIIIDLGPCALNIKFQHFILRFNKISLFC
jgi:hypothetical protein